MRGQLVRMSVVATLIAAAVAALGATPAHGFSAFTPAAGSVFVEFSYSQWQADERFAGPFGADLAFDGGREVGDVVPVKLDTEGDEFFNSAFNLSLQVAATDALVFGVFFPVFQRSEFRQSTQTTTTEGTGDIYTAVGYRLTPIDLSDMASTLYLHVKIPTTSAQFEDLAVPLSEGQTDVAIESTTTWAPIPQLHLSGRLLFRYRFEVEEELGGSLAVIKPGNETELGFSVGGSPVPYLWFTASYNALFAQPRQDRSVPQAFVATEQREIQTLDLGTYFNFGYWLPPSLHGLALDLWYRHPVAGADYLRGGSFGVGLAFVAHL